MDHYAKFGDNNIHMANMLYALAAITALVMILGALLSRAITKDFASLELINNRRKEKRDQRRFS
jgi:hypothetical protein